MHPLTTKLPNMSSHLQLTQQPHLKISCVICRPHINKLDVGAVFTVMTLILSTPSDYSPGMFAFHDFKFIIMLAEISIVYFTGLHLHGGTTPLPLKGQKPNPNTFCLAIICYPNGNIMQGLSRNVLAPWRAVSNKGSCSRDLHEVLKVPPEICYREK